MLETSDLPGGVINIVTGQRDVLTRTLVEHQDVDAMWYFGSAEGSYHVEHLSSKNMKRTLVDYGVPRDWLQPSQGEGHEPESTRARARTHARARAGAAHSGSQCIPCTQGARH